MKITVEATGTIERIDRRLSADARAPSEADEA